MSGKFSRVMILGSLLALAFGLRAAGAGAAAAATTTRPTMAFENPVIAGFAPDPTICRSGDDFYLANSSFTMRPGLPIYHSRDLVRWDLIGYAAGADSGASFVGATTQGGVYAPTLRHHAGRFYLIVKNTTTGHNELYSTTDPAGQWSEPARIGPDWDGDIDPDLFFDADGAAYLARRIGIGNGARAEQFAWRFDPRTARVTSEKFPIWNGTGEHVWPEGGHLYRVGSYYYYMLAEGGTGTNHRVTIARKPVGKGLDDLSQEWEPCPRNPILFNDPAAKPAIVCTGHADLVEDAAGHWWMVFLGQRPTPAPDLGRETYLAPVEWRDGWPVVNDGKPITPKMTASFPLPAGMAGVAATVTRPSGSTRDDFTTPKLALCWNFLRVIDPATFSLAERPGWLTLHGTSNDLLSKQAVAWIGQRLLDKSARISARLNFAPAVEGQVAGINLFSRSESSAEFIVRYAGGRREAIVRINAAKTSTTKGVNDRSETSTTSDPVALPGESPVLLEMTIANERIVFRVSGDDGQTWSTVKDIAVKEAVDFPGFAGMYVGMHAIGQGATARFDYFEYEPLTSGAPAASAPGSATRGAPRFSSAAVPAQRKDPNSMLAHEQLVAKAKTGGIDLYFLGDSITRRWGCTDPQWAANLENWKQNFYGWNAANFGWGADAIQNMLWRIQNGELDGVNPKVIVILAGTNNVGNRPAAGDDNDEKVADILAGLRALIDTCREKAPQAKIILTAIFPRNDNPAVLPEIQKINEGLGKFADGNTIYYLNVNDKLAGPDGVLLDGMTIDKLHLSVKGYQVWADGLRPLLTELLGPRAKTDHAPPATGDPSVVRPAAAP
jgi:alpha-N-arabinofuranosidase